MVAYFLCVGELLRAHGLVRHGGPRGRFCFCRTSRLCRRWSYLHRGVIGEMAAKFVVC